MTGIESIAAERQRQIEAEGWTAEHDDRHVSGELAQAAAAYALNALEYEDGSPFRFMGAQIWPWPNFWKPSASPRRDLVKAGALIAAEIDRIDRLEGRST